MSPLRLLSRLLPGVLAALLICLPLHSVAAQQGVASSARAAAEFDGDVYILRGGQVNLGGNGSIVGEGVTIFLMEDAQFTVNGNETVNLTPPSSGHYAGVTIYQEKSNDAPVVINGTADSVVSGFIYAPAAHVFYAGNSETETEARCLRLIGNTIEMIGNSSIRSDCGDELGSRSIYAGRYMAIVR